MRPVEPTAVYEAYRPLSPSAQGTEAVNYQRSLTIYIGGDGQVFVLDRISPDRTDAKSQLSKQRFGPALRKLITEAKQATDRRTGLDERGKSQFACLIKTLPEADYRTMVKAMDEMAACKIERYALMDSLTQREHKLLRPES